MGILLAKKLSPDAVLPTVGHPGEDLGFDLYASETVTLEPGEVVKVKTDIALRYVEEGKHYGLLVRDRSSMASKGITTSAGVIDEGYTGEVVVLLTLNGNGTLREAVEDLREDIRGAGSNEGIDALEYFPVNEFELAGPTGYLIAKGDKIAQVIPVEVKTGPVALVEAFEALSRGDAGFGSTGA
jgi:dUTP pyrophosphatase